MGDYFSTDYTKMKAYTVLEIKLDFYEVTKEALKRTHDWMTAAQRATGQFSWQECPPPTPKGYYELMKKQLYNEFSGDVTNFDRKFYINSTRFKKELDDYIDELSFGRYLGDCDWHTDAYDMYADTQDLVGRCFTLKYRSNSTVSSITEFDSMFRKHVEEIVAEQKNLIEKGGFMDSILVKVNRKQEHKRLTTSKYMGQSALDFDCITQATKADYDPLMEYKPCVQKSNVLKFKLVEGFL
jgi:hypothetical protein